MRIPLRYTTPYQDKFVIESYHCPDCICDYLSPSGETQMCYGSKMNTLKCNGCGKSWIVYSLISLSREDARDRRISKIVNI